MISGYVCRYYELSFSPHCTVPLWELAPHLEFLSIGRLSNRECNVMSDHWNQDCLGIDEVAEEELATFTAPSTSCAADEKALVATAWRMIATAARGGKLRRLPIAYPYRQALWKPFAIRSLMPAWVGIDEWGTHEVDDLQSWDVEGLGWEIKQSEVWYVAALVLRRFLYHTSLMSPAQSDQAEDATANRLLTCGDVQEMHPEFIRNGMPRLSNPELHGAPPLDEEIEGLLECSPFDCYLYWLADDAELAQQVADTWNAVVKRGGADLLRCYRCKCYTPRDISC